MAARNVAKFMRVHRNRVGVLGGLRVKGIKRFRGAQKQNNVVGGFYEYQNVDGYDANNQVCVCVWGCLVD